MFAEEKHRVKIINWHNKEHEQNLKSSYPKNQHARVRGDNIEKKVCIKRGMLCNASFNQKYNNN